MTATPTPWVGAEPAGGDVEYGLEVYVAGTWERCLIDSDRRGCPEGIAWVLDRARANNPGETYRPVARIVSPFRALDETRLMALLPPADPLAAVRDQLADAGRLAAEGSAQIDEAILTRRFAFEAIPVGTVLTYRFSGECQVIKDADGWTSVDPEHLSVPTPAWVLEEWERGSWILPTPEVTS